MGCGHARRPYSSQVTAQPNTINLTLPMLLSPKAQGCKDFQKPSKSGQVGIHWKALAEYSQMSTHLPGFQSFFTFLQNFALAKLATSSKRVNIIFKHKDAKLFKKTSKPCHVCIHWNANFFETHLTKPVMLEFIG